MNLQLLYLPAILCSFVTFATKSHRSISYCDSRVNPTALARSLAGLKSVLWG